MSNNNTYFDTRITIDMSRVVERAQADADKALDDYAIASKDELTQYVAAVYKGAAKDIVTKEVERAVRNAVKDMTNTAAFKSLIVATIKQQAADLAATENVAI